MKKETFIKILELQSEHYQKSHKAYELGLDLIEFTETQETVIYLLWSEILTQYGQNWLDFWLYEKDYISGEIKEHIKAWDEKGNEIIKSIDELYDYLVENKYFKI